MLIFVTSIVPTVTVKGPGPTYTPKLLGLIVGEKVGGGHGVIIVIVMFFVSAQGIDWGKLVPIVTSVSFKFR